jgi:hypothetical protein
VGFSIAWVRRRAPVSTAAAEAYRRGRRRVRNAGSRVALSSCWRGCSILGAVKARRVLARCAGDRDKRVDTRRAAGLGWARLEVVDEPSGFLFGVRILPRESRGRR